MITRIQLIRNIGQFNSVDAGSTIPLSRFVLIYAENGRGKSTLAAILRSLASGDALSIRERRRLSAANPPHVVLQCSDAANPAVFENGAWSRTLPGVVVFDEQFVDENLCSGVNVEAGHRQNLHELVLGIQGVTLSRRLQELVNRIEQHNTELRNKASGITPSIRGSLSVDDFCMLPSIPNIDDRIRVAERGLAAAVAQDLVRTTPRFDVLRLPAFDIVSITRILGLDLPSLDIAAALRVQEHLLGLGQDGEAWVADGMRRVVHADGGREVCPFCAQSLVDSPVISHYRAYFSEEYSLLRRSIAAEITEIDRLHGEDVRTNFERAVRVSIERRQFWSGLCDVPQIGLDTEAITRAWREALLAIKNVLQAKQSSPLEPIQIPRTVHDAIASFEAHRRLVSDLNQRLLEANGRITSVKDAAATADSQALGEDLRALRVIRDRYTPEVDRLCEQYLAESSAKSATEHLRNRAKADLEQYRAAAFPSSQAAINAYLARFGAGFSVGRVTPVDTRGGPTCNYDVVINDTAVAVDGADQLGEPSFRSTLSSGDRSTLALAFFLSSLDRDPALADKVIAIDDPITSLDENRSLTTVQELRRLGSRVSQLFVLSHDKGFLCRIWQHIDQSRCSSIQIEREGAGSTLAPWDVSSDSVSEHDRNHALLRSYLREGPTGNSRVVAERLRSVLEAFLRVAYPEHFPPKPRILGIFRRLCRERCGTGSEILSSRDTQELDDLVEYADLFHHDTNTAGAPVVVNDAQLRSFAERILRFTAR
jgi:wobble nucleotide-excising tRNase